MIYTKDGKNVLIFNRKLTSVDKAAVLEPSSFCETREGIHKSVERVHKSGESVHKSGKADNSSLQFCSRIPVGKELSIYPIADHVPV